jgi:DNA polymerase III epsilon subunit-like protein
MDLHELVVKLKQLAQELDKTPTLMEFVVKCGISKRQIHKHKYSNIVKAAGLDPNKHAQTTEPITPVIRPPRIAIFDLELVGMEVKTYQLKTDYISPKNILKDWAILSYAVKFKDEDEIHYYDQRKCRDKRNDKLLATKLHKILSEADIIVGHNSDNFDIKKFNTKVAVYGLPPLPLFTKFDTVKIARKYFAFSSNSLWYIAKALGLKNQKSDHGKFPGDSLENECMAGNIEAWDEMEKYNKQDVLTTEELFVYLSKYEPAINFQSFYQDTVCSCGNNKFFKDGFKHNRQGKFQVYRCHICAKTFMAKENLIHKSIRKEFFK